jgi:hypothetical protein
MMDNIKRQRKIVHASVACFCCHEFKKDDLMVMEEGQRAL